MEQTNVAAPDSERAALTATEVEALLSTMTKALRAFHMYQSNNPVFQRFREGLRAAFQEVWARTDKLELGVQEEGFRWGGQTFAVGQGRDSLPFAFYKDGIRSLVFLRGFEAEVAAFLDSVTQAMRSEEGGDIITVLWEKDFASLQYGYVDLLAEGVSVPEDPLSDQPLTLDLSSLEADLAEDEEDLEEGEGAAGAPSPGLSHHDFDETLYFLDHTEMAALQTEVQVEMDRDLRRDVVNALFDRLEDASRPERQAEILDILDQLLPLFLSRGELKNAARILEELDTAARGDALDDALKERVERLFARLSDAAVLEQFVQALEDGAVSPQAAEVTLFFSRLRPEAMPVLIRFAETSHTPGVRGRLASAIDGLATRHPQEVSRLLQADEPSVVTGAARVAGRTGLGPAVGALHTALSHKDRDVRIAVVEALVAIRSTAALQALMDALTDSDRDVRIEAARALAAVRFASARERLAEVVEGKQLKGADLTEKMAFFEAYGAIGGSAAVERLDEILNRRGLLGRRRPTDLRACAALALGRAATPAARKALEKSKEDDDPIVRNAVLRALRQETEAGAL